MLSIYNGVAYLHSFFLFSLCLASLLLSKLSKLHQPWFYIPRGNCYISFTIIMVSTVWYGNISLLYVRFEARKIN